jgi:copper(I)-binding protein
MKRLILACLLWPAIVVADVEIVDPWIQNLPPTVPVRAGYMTLTNSGSQDVKIVALRGAGFTRIEIHRSVMRDGTMHMEQLPELEIGAGERLGLEPGGLHLMMYPEEPTRPGDTHRILIEFGDGSTRTIEMTVRK